MSFQTSFRQAGRGRTSQAVGGGLNAQAWDTLRACIENVGEAFESKSTQRALAAGARAIARVFRRAADTKLASEYRNDPARLRAKQKRFPGFKRLREVIKGGEGLPEWFPSAKFAMGGKGARQFWLVDQGHAGPTPESPRTPASPFAEQAWENSQRPRDEAILKKFQAEFPKIAEEVRKLSGT